MGHLVPPPPPSLRQQPPHPTVVCAYCRGTRPSDGRACPGCGAREVL